MTAFTTKSADFAERVRRSCARQSLMGTIGAGLTKVEPGLVRPHRRVQGQLLAPASGERLVASERVVKRGRTLIVALAEVQAESGGERRLISIMTATLMAVERDGLAD